MQAVTVEAEIIAADEAQAVQAVTVEAKIIAAGGAQTMQAVTVEAEITTAQDPVETAPAKAIILKKETEEQDSEKETDA